MTEDHEMFRVKLDLDEQYRFDVDFGIDSMPPLTLDEPPPLGELRGPNASRVLAAAVGNCLAASLLYCLRRSRVEVAGMGVEVEGWLERNKAGRLRIGGINVKLAPTIGAGDTDRLERCQKLFEDFCIVTGSVREGIDIEVEVEPSLPTVSV